MSDSRSRWPWPRVIAHRGGGRFAPENTLAAIRRGHAMGFRAVEFDVMLAADLVPVLIHDETLERTTNSRGRVAEHSSAALAALDAGSWFGAAFSGEPVPTFADAARLCRALGLWANIEIKPATGQDIETGQRTALLTADLWKNAPGPLPLLSSFSAPALAAARDLAPQFPRGLLVDAAPADWQSRASALGCASLHCNQAKLDEATAREVVAAGYGLATYTVNDPAIARRLLDWGVDAVFTDRLDLIGANFA
ncbi:MAG: glycerophosphodiester phosphodiesterase [Betaproteobacteria bacterium]|nr:glycerophosphodiester phosphodiesterase [Betaproteobacteria bacterium]